MINFSSVQISAINLGFLNTDNIKISDGNVATKKAECLCRFSCLYSLFLNTVCW